MGSSASASVFWGYDLGDMYGLSDEDNDFISPDLRPGWMKESDDWQWEPELARRLGAGEDPSWATIWDLTEPFGVEMDWYGHIDGSRRWLLRVDESEFSADYSSCTSLGGLRVSPHWRGNLDRVAELLELPVWGEPGWHVSVTFA